jgi:hypothetical protein
MKFVTLCMCFTNTSCLRAHDTFTTFSPICFFNLLDMKSSPVMILKFYTVRILPLSLTASLVMWSRHLTMYGKILGSNPIETSIDLFFNKVFYYVMLHFYLQQPGIIKMFLLYNISGKVPLFFLYKQDIMQVNCMQNITKYYILLRNVAYVLKIVFLIKDI